MRRRRRGMLVIALGATLLTAACSTSRSGGLQVKGYPADVVFAAKKAPAAPLLGAVPSDLTAEQAMADLGLGLPPDVTSRTPPAKYLGPPAEPRPVCRSAPPGAAATAAAVTVPAGLRPETGVFRWRKEGTLTLAVNPNAKVPVGGFEQRKVRNVKELGNDVFSFETVQPDITGRYLRVVTWQVKPNPVAERISAVALAISAGDPERGVAIKAIDTLDLDGKPAAGQPQFHPTTALLVLPLPVVPGEQFTSVAVDPTTQETAVYQAQVGARDRVDACGNFVEGWAVTGTLTSSAEGASYAYGLWIAPQVGALPILEKVTRSQAGVGDLDVTYTLGQLHPDKASAP